MIKDRMKMFIECHVPIKACNFRCEYCYVTQNKWWDSEKPGFSLCLEKIEDAISIERIGGIAMFNLCATGETLLYPEMIEIIHKILKVGHYVMVVTNGTMTDRFRACCAFSEDERSRLFFKFSFHYLELKKKGWVEKYFLNVSMVKNAGISFTVELTPDDCYIPYIEEIKSVCMENLGVLCHVTVTRDETKPGYPLMTNLEREHFYNTWSQFDSDLFRFKWSIFEKKRKEYCYAGKWSIVLELGTGEYAQCYKGKRLGNLYEDVSKPLVLYAVGHNCTEGHCFNGHAFLGFGLIPELEVTDYADQRNRTCADKSHWLTDRMECFMRQKLYDVNDRDEGISRITSDIRSVQITNRAKKAVKKIIGK